MLFVIVRTIVLTFCITLAGMTTIHTLQANRYQISALRRQMRQRGSRLLAPDILIGVLTALIDWYLPVAMSMLFTQQEQRETVCGWIVLAALAGVSVVVFLRRRKIEQPKPFSWTRRVLRLVIVVGLINLAAVLLLTLISISPYLVFAAAEYSVLLAALIMRPIEDRINARFYSAARKKLAAHPDIRKIAITGSYGKTQVKMILKSILSEKYCVLATPPSFSAAMGISRVINEQLKPDHQVFIAEMGAQHRGEIREMTRLVNPDIGVITGIGDVHLDTFGSIRNVAQAKYELIMGMREGGIAVFGSDGGYGDRLYALCKGEKYRAGTNTKTECDMRADHIETSVQGTRFELTCENGRRIWMKTRLLGAFNVQNITIAACVAHRMGMTIEEIARAVEKIPPMRRNMQLISSDIYVIDDSDNATAAGARVALDVLRDFPGRRILVTQGFGDMEENADEINYELGTYIPGCADYVVLLDPEFTRPMMQAMLDRGFPKSAVRMFGEEADAAGFIAELAKAGDTVLYEGVYPKK